MDNTYNELLDNIRNQNSVEASVHTLVQGFIAENVRLSDENKRLREEKGKDEASEPSLAEQIGDDHKLLVEAITANTPASRTPPADEQEARRRDEDDRRRAEDEEAQRQRDEDDPAHAPLDTSQINTSAGLGPQDPTITRPAEKGTKEGLPS
jgi:hypothetical protein